MNIEGYTMYITSCVIFWYNVKDIDIGKYWTFILAVNKLTGNEIGPEWLKRALLYFVNVICYCVCVFVVQCLTFPYCDNKAYRSFIFIKLTKFYNTSRQK